MVRVFALRSFSLFSDAISRKIAIIAAAIPLQPIPDKIVRISQSQMQAGIRSNSEITIVQMYIFLFIWISALSFVDITFQGF